MDSHSLSRGGKASRCRHLRGERGDEGKREEWRAREERERKEMEREKERERSRGF